jgi:thymidylate synthase ThyX
MLSSIFQTMVKRQVYLLSPKELNPETIAVAFAKTSRSPESFRKIASELNEETSTNFHERWVVGYGHASVAEHAVLHIAIENVSRLAVECIEANRLASYTEKSTRYQRWDVDSFYHPNRTGRSSFTKDLYPNMQNAFQNLWTMHHFCSQFSGEPASSPEK